MTRSTKKIAVIACLLIMLAQVSKAQTTSFSFQGSLADNGAPANGNYDFEFALFNAANAGTQAGSTVARNGVQVVNGSFWVPLDFGAQFPGAARFLEIRVRQAGGGAFTLLSPRQPVNSSPYAIRSLNAASADSVAVGGVPAGSANYINNSAVQQASSNFNISGNGTVAGTLSANFVSAGTQYNIGSLRVLSSPGSNVFAGILSGQTFSAGSQNAFFGYEAGRFTNSANNNSFFGGLAGRNNTGFGNSFFGASAGQSNTTGGLNSFFGNDVGQSNTIGATNAFFGHRAGFSNTEGSGNTLIGIFAGSDNTTGGDNSFLGAFAGDSNVTGNRNVVIGTLADVLSGDLTNAAAIGYRAAVGASNSLVLGSIDGVNGATADAKVGIGTTAPTERMEIRDNNGSIIFGGAGCPSGSVSIGLNGPFGSCDTFTLRGNGTDVLINRPTGGEVLFRENNGSTQVRIRPGGVVQIPNLGTAGSTALCRNASSDISTCSSSIRYKNNVEDFSSGADILRRLRPVTFNWKDSGTLDLGLVAEEVAEIDPLLVTYNKNGSVEGVKYDRIGVVLVNVVKEQQKTLEVQSSRLKVQGEELERQKEKGKRQNERIEELEKRLSTQGDQIEALKALVCADKPGAAFCR